MSELLLKTLEENEHEVYLEVTDILLRIIDNVLNSPRNPKFRKLRLGNDIVSNKLIPAIGAMECLFHLGFQEADDALVLPETVPLDSLRDFKRAIADSRTKVQRKQKPCVNLLQNRQNRYNDFLEELRDISKRVLIYEDEKLQQAARDKMPLDELKKRRDEHISKSSSTYEMEFGLLFELIVWFKTEFFQWMNNPTCSKCKSSSTFQGYSSNPAELIETTRVEVFKCDRCNDRLIFPRHNNPARLLETRVGRCGEWANCFTLFCRTIGLEARYVMDKTDHVWTEVYSQTLKRWVHCDPCEGAIDTPLMYEKGWSKKLSYVIAFSNEEVQDVTWRYTAQFAEVRSRRVLCNEDDLLRLIFQLTNALQTSLSPDRKKYLAMRRVVECVEFLTPPHSDKQFGGRTSGSLAWRISRGESRSGNKVSVEWKPNEVELQRRQFRLKYSTALDRYYRVESDEVIEGWSNGIFDEKSMYRKVEHDWKTCYLCRLEGTNDAMIKWKFTTEGTDYVIDLIKISYSSVIFQNGYVRWILCNEETCVPLKAEKTLLESRAFHGSTEVSLTATLSGGNGDTAWQHAQIFRQPNDSNDCPFELFVTLTKKTKQ
ncbi:peptide-N(4)-(N-acetyl-beta-glucosaminyl)asparagine amidase [Planococcus citri]|uniref:peptide-N(4)-(N-acetyl-beta- glucosaminyl)asparagine amidase n=1 Tax=Planococcus citri TaxID=170843 RepID=UPI0031F7AED1